MIESFDQFHFLRPYWLLALAFVALLWRFARPKRQTNASAAQGIAPHLAEALQVGSNQSQRFLPIDGVMICGLLLVLAVAGPTWSRIPNPLVAETAPLAVAMKVSESMEQSDLAPSRLERSKFKILDLIAARAGARTALIAYSGTAHRVAPLTEDPNILRPLLEALSPAVMPVSGDAAPDALELAIDNIGQETAPGAVLFVLDDMDPAQVEAFLSDRDPPRPPVIFLTALPAGSRLSQLDKIPNAKIVEMTADDSDISTIERAVRSAYAAALADDDRLDWNDRGWILGWPALLLILFWFRRGWTMKWLGIGTFAIWSLAPQTSYAEGWKDWFWTPDQQGQRALNDKEFAKAATLFQDPYLQAYAAYKAGQYAEAAELFAAQPTADAAFSEGMARIRNREYRPAIAAFDKALERKPDWQEAKQNRDLAKVILDYVETSREQSDTGEDSGIGADDVVFDNAESKGQDTVIQASDTDSAQLTSEQWISSIDTDMRKFLRSRFLLDNQGDRQ
jgi:Ca-activated chloride channel homolog